MQSKEQLASDLHFFALQAVDISDPKSREDTILWTQRVLHSLFVQ